MILVRHVTVDGQAFCITISDEYKALSDALASGGAILGVWNKDQKEFSCPADYMIEDVSQIDDDLLEKVVRRHHSLPWIIGETSRVILRELVPGDETIIGTWTESADIGGALSHREGLLSYLKSQYRFFEYGIWAVTLKRDGSLIGLSGISNFQLADGSVAQELGYHIWLPYRELGYGKEACVAVMDYAWRELELPALYARIDASNEASINLAESLGFQFIQTDNESGIHRHLYVVYCP